MPENKQYIYGSAALQKISNQVMPGHFIAELGHAFRNLFFHGLAGNIHGKISAAAEAAEDTAPSVQSPVTIGTGHPGIQGYFVTFMVKRIFTIGIQRVVGLAVPVSGDVRLIHRLY